MTLDYHDPALAQAYNETTSILAAHQKDSLASSETYSDTMAVVDAILTLAAVIRAGQIANQ